METTSYNYLEELNAQQRAAVEYCDGPSLVIAGAGSGKTRVLTYKIMHLIRLGIEPHRILALTFTNKAAREMKERISRVVGDKIASRIRMGTFHSLFLRILRVHTELIGFKSNFTIYDSTDSKTLIKQIIKELALDEKQYKPSSVASLISNAKNAMMTPEQYRNAYYDSDRKAKRPMVSEIFSRYTARCRMANAMDFDDILFHMNNLLRDNPDVLHHYQEFFRFILVDEYQDTNFAQHVTVSMLAKPDMKICVVGDDAQSIYSFRGANIANIINLEKSFPGLRTFKLERNYRSTRNIVNAAGSLIKKNRQQLPKQVYSENEVGAPVNIISTYSDLEEAYTVSTDINATKLKEHDTYDEYAILYRTNAQSRVLEEALRKRNIGYRIVGGTAFYQRKEIKDVIGYFRVAVNPDDDEAMRRIINFPARGIGETTVKRLQAAAIERGTSLWETIDNIGNIETGLNSGAIRKLNTFAAMIREFITDNKMSNAFELGQLIYNRTGILLLYANDNTPENIARQENMAEMLNGLKDFVEIRLEEGEEHVDMAAFISEVSLATDADEKEKSDEPKVTMMTVHAAKGLEFKHVYIVGAEEDLFPSAMSMNSLAEIEEERRLMYVAITRAKKRCTITYAKTRFRNGQTKISSPSRFLFDIDPKYVRIESSSNNSSASDGEETFINPMANYNRRYSDHRYGQAELIGGGNPMHLATSSRHRMVKVKDAAASGTEPMHRPGNLKTGMKIEHSKFGRGTITKTGNISGEPSITVVFDTVGTKNLLLRYAKFNILS